ncbi:hypothetical protein ACQ4PT_028392 [Festuca glaucescens]
MPVDLSQWVMKCYDQVKSELVIPNRGKIPVDAESVYRVWGLPNSGLKVCYEMKIDIIKAINEEYGFPGTNAPDKTAWCKMIKDMNGVADDRFLRAWAIVAFDCFLAPTTGLKIRVAFSALGNKKSVCCCVFHLVMMYLDSLEVNEVISDYNPRVDAWDSSLISKVKKKDMISPGVFGKLQLKEKYRDTQQGGLFGGLLKAEQFIASNLPRDYDQSKKRKIGVLLYGLCSEFEESMAKFVQGIGNLEQRTTARSTSHANVVPKAKPQRPRKTQRTSQEEEAPLQDDTDDSANSDDDETANLILNDDDTEDDRREDDDDDDDDDDREYDNNDGDNNDHQQDHDNQGDAEDDGEEGDDINGEEDEVEGNEDDEEEEEEEEDGDDFDSKGGDDRDDDSDGDGGNNAATGMQGGQNDVSGDDETSDDSRTTAQYYLNTRSKRGSTSSGDKRKKKDEDGLPTTTMEDASLPDLCRMEKRSKLPDIPPMEEHAVF